MPARRIFAATWALFVSWSVTFALAGQDDPPQKRPNILWITCEDISPHLGCYGDDFATTPNLDALARRGVRYTHAFATASVCSPARSCLITGVYPISLGTQHLRSRVPLPKAIKCFPEYLRAAGYYCTNNVKEDYQFITPPETWDESSRRAGWRKRGPDQPFFSVFNLTCTHQSQVRLRGDALAARTASLTPGERHDPAKVPLPPYYPDAPEVRRDMANLYDLITVMDKQAGELLGQLEEDGLTDETIVFFYSDHGTGLPRHKRWLYDSGVHVPLIIHFPEKFRDLAPGDPGSTEDRLVSFVDFAPTVLSLVGLEIPAYMQGVAFLGPKAGEPKEYVFAVRDRVDEVCEMSRTVRDARFRYIRNYMPHRARMQYGYFSEQTPTRRAFRRLAAGNQLTGAPLEFMSTDKPPEELYDTVEDPHELVNLAESPQHEEILGQMRKALWPWMIEKRDTGLLPEAEIHTRSEETTPYEMAKLDQKFPVARILGTAELVGKGPEHQDELAQHLTDADSAVRYWAAVGLLALGSEAKASEAALLKASADPSPSVRIAAAEALCAVGQEAKALPVLIAALDHEDGWVRFQAAVVLGKIGPKARPALADMKTLLAEKSKHETALYVRWALERAVSELE
jgi:arylsulfatase A-like enzyme